MRIKDPEQESNIRVGDTVLIRQRKQNKWPTKFDPFPFIVVRRKGTMITASRNGKYISRNVSHFKKINSPYRNPQSDISDDDDTDILPENNAETVPRNESPYPHQYPRRDRRPTRRYRPNVYEH